ncbi:hypothetical protein ACH4TV_32265 [Streptomyces sp. NPDC020898]|uniref:hypothetical protein n=1 Tax=Streptomyces sp. NPDC020898 TaxID=3365101 RepID=UPI003796D1B6
MEVAVNVVGLRRQVAFVRDHFGTLPLIVFMRAATCAALTLGGGACLADLL